MCNSVLREMWVPKSKWATPHWSAGLPDSSSMTCSCPEKQQWIEVINSTGDLTCSALRITRVFWKKNFRSESVLLNPCQARTIQILSRKNRVCLYWFYVGKDLFPTTTYQIFKELKVLYIPWICWSQEEFFEVLRCIHHRTKVRGFLHRLTRKRVLTVQWTKRDARSEKGMRHIYQVVEFLKTGKCPNCTKGKKWVSLG